VSSSEQRLEHQFTSLKEAQTKLSETEKLIVGGLVTTLLLFAPGFVLHEAPRFPGSLAGGVLGIFAALMMLLLLIYPLVKRVVWLRQRLTTFVPTRAILSFHVYVGALGAVLGILHTGHKFHSPLGITLVIAMVSATLSGFVGRYYMAHLTTELRDQKVMLDTMRAEYDRLSASVAGHPVVRGFLGLWRAAPVTGTADESALSAVVRTIADLEFSMRQHEGIKRAFAGWIFVHIIAAIVMYAALALHIWNSVYFGLRWLQ
jgi:hypothetical protein